MIIEEIIYCGNDGWQNQTRYYHTPSESLHIPRVGDFVMNKDWKMYQVESVTWGLQYNSVSIRCKLVEKKEGEVIGDVKKEGKNESKKREIDGKPDLRTFRKEHHLTQATVAEYLGCTKGFISQVENGRVELPYEKGQKLKEWKI